jgi:hypothetical protein
MGKGDRRSGDPLWRPAAPVGLTGKERRGRTEDLESRRLHASGTRDHEVRVGAIAVLADIEAL